MFKLPRKALMGLLLGPLITISAIAQSASPKLSAEIDAANAKFVQLFGQGDGSVATLYADGATICPPNSDFIQGMSAIRDFWKGAYDAGIKKVKLETVNVESSGPIAQETGKYTLYSADDKLIDTGKYIVVWKKEKGSWMLYRDIWNTSAPAPAK
jgi:ketosteroid isomerase-like protein